MKKLLHNRFASILPARLFLILSMLAAMPATVLAQQENDKADKTEPQRWFTVEIVTFSRAKSPLNDEIWPLPAIPETATDSLATDDASAPAMADTKAMPGDVTPSENAPIELSQKDFQLSKEAYSIGRSALLTIRSHQAWRLIGLPAEQAPWLDIDNAQQQSITGQVRISLARFLHADVALKIRNPDYSAFNQTPELQVPEYIDFTAHRRLRSGELHYIDHPLAGILMKIEKYQPPVIEETTKSVIAPATPQIN